MSAPARAFTVRQVQLLRALFAAAAALMITFSPDHSAAVGLSVFSGFVLATALVLVLAAWLVLPAGQRWPCVVLAALGFVAGMAAGIPAWRTDDVYFGVVTAWALTTGVAELIAGLRARRAGDQTARDAIAVGGFGILLGILLLVIPAGFAQPYAIEGAGDFVLTGIILGVGMLGGYAAILAVFLGIAGLTPKRADAVTPADDAAQTTDHDSATPAERGGER
ncbi:acyl-CoA synthetase [Microbacterium sp. SD291]|uniref:acyl-CoA synthetase n=1 Tax=Microbacterium sp. SD291 TaxID=2782007 RepID=UPI001A95685D|nr:acyl-CoA synthetase [Microbacterium sp. SD291]MBO0980208.1 acyl-CoA synthetase [Microbacterium sp. SD291]